VNEQSLKYVAETNLILTSSKAEPILGSVTRFGRVSDTRQYSVLGRHKPAHTEH